MAERPRKKNEPRAWQRMLSGRRLDLLDPSPFDIEIEDIAHGLARVARWNGQTIGEHAFSVAQHSVVVEEIAAHIKPGLDPKWRLAALLHDASEYVIGDMISPKPASAACCANASISARRRPDSGGRMSRVPLGALKVGSATRGQATGHPSPPCGYSCP